MNNGVPIRWRYDIKRSWMQFVRNAEGHGVIHDTLELIHQRSWKQASRPRRVGLPIITCSDRSRKPLIRQRWKSITPSPRGKNSPTNVHDVTPRAKQASHPGRLHMGACLRGCLSRSCLYNSHVPQDAAFAENSARSIRSLKSVS